MSAVLQPSDFPRARASDPYTSHLAATNASAFAGTHSERILKALDSITTGTAHEIAQACGLTVVQIDRRLCELARIEKVRFLTMDGKPLIRDGFRVWAKA